MILVVETSTIQKLFFAMQFMQLFMLFQECYFRYTNLLHFTYLSGFGTLRT